MSPGIYPNMSAELYHGDPCPEPSMSAGAAATVIQRTPLHAWTEHPKNPNFVPGGESTSEQDEGTALHALLLERQDRVEAVDAADWRTKAAQESRRAIREAGRIPLLQHRWDELRQCADAFREQIAKHEVGDFIARGGMPECTALWQDESEAGDIWCRARIDWLGQEGMMFDLKTTAQAANPEAWFRGSRDATIRAAHYLRGARAVIHARPRYFFVLLERQPPYALSVCELSPALLTIGEEQHTVARNVWAACCRDGEWPAFPPFLATIEADNGAIYRHEDWKQRLDQIRTRKPRPFHNQSAPSVVNAEQPFG